MKRVIFLSDVHGNLPALRAVAEVMPPADAVYVAGDLVFEGPCPAQTLDFLLETGWNLIMGNTDRDLVWVPRAGKKLRQQRIAWTRRQLGTFRLQQLAGLPFSARLTGSAPGDVLVVHANPKTMDTHLYPDMSAEALAPYLAGTDASLLVFGHLHIPYLRPVGHVVLLDTSSVGQPKDLDHRAVFSVVTWNDGGRAIEQVRVPYDLERTMALLRASGMPGAEKAVEELARASY